MYYNSLIKEEDLLMNIIKTVRQMIEFVTIKLVTTKLTPREVNILIGQYVQDNEDVIETIKRIEELSGKKITTLLEWLRFINNNTYIGWNEKDGIRDYAWRTTINDVELSTKEGICCVEIINYKYFPINNRKQYNVKIKSWLDRLKFNRMVERDLKLM